MLPSRLTWIDETNRADHRFLAEGDRCLFLGEYFAGKSYKGGGTNQLIFNFKCPPSKAAASAGRKNWKERAINEIAAGLRATVATQENAESVTWVPIPTSKVCGHPEYDDRLIRTLWLAFTGYRPDIRLLLRQAESTDADHVSGFRITVETLYDLLAVDQTALASQPIRPGGIVLFDDVLTTGKHFKCCQHRLKEALSPETEITGLFVARRVLPNPFDDFED